jgi:hypothetical protein
MILKCHYGDGPAKVIEHLCAGIFLCECPDCGEYDSFINVPMPDEKL